MKAYIQWGILLLAAVSMVACSSEKKSDPVSVGQARITYLSGDVKVIVNSAEQPAQLGGFLNSGDRVITGDMATAELFVKGQGIVRIASDADITIESLDPNGKNSFKLDKGTGAFFLEKQDRKGEFEVRAPTAIAGVRGTSFLVNASENESNVALIDGAVEVSNEMGNVVIDKSSEITIKKGVNPVKVKPIPLSQNNLQKIKKLAVFQKNNILEYNALLDRLKQSKSLQSLEVNETVEGKYAQLRDTTENAERVQRASKQEEKILKRDTEGDPLKLSADKTYK